MLSIKITQGDIFCTLLPNIAINIFEIQTLYFKQECIPVGCVPPAAVAVRGGLNQAPPQTRHPKPGTHLEQAPPGTRPPPGPGTPPDQAPPRTRHPQTRHPPVDRHTPVNILPCPKLRLRAVIIIFLFLSERQLISRSASTHLIAFTHALTLRESAAPFILKVENTSQRTHKLCSVLSF